MGLLQMTPSSLTYFISIEELTVAFLALPTNQDGRIRLIALPIKLINQKRQISVYQLQFDWNTASRSWELGPDQPLIITASK
jgi:hypothetical protein